MVELLKKVPFMLLKKLKKSKFIIHVTCEKGFSLIELTVAAGLIGILSLGIFQTIQNATNISYGSSQKVEIFQLLAQIKANLQNTEKCRKTFGGLNPISGVSLKQVGRIETNKFYGTGGGRVKVISMELKNYNKETTTSDLEVIFQRYAGQEKRMVEEKRVLKIKTTLNPQDLPDGERGDPNLIQGCVTDTDTYLRDNCEISFEGNYSNQKNCKSITVRTSSKKDFAINSKDNVVIKGSSDDNQKGDIKVNGYSKSRNQNLANSLTVHNELLIGSDKKVKMSLKSNTDALTLMGFKTTLKSMDIKTSLGKKINFKIENNNLILDADNSFEKLTIDSSNQDSVESSLSSKSGVIATRQWTYQTLAYLFSKSKTDTFNSYLKGAIDKITNDQLEKTIVKAIGKHMCERYFTSFVWEGGVCKPDIECGENELLTVKLDGDIPKFVCKEVPDWRCVNRKPARNNSGTGKCYKCGKGPQTVNRCGF